MIEHKNATGILLFDKNNRLVLQLRAINDDSYPAHWDFSAAGGLKPDEDPEICITREAEEELGIKELAGLKFLREESYQYPAWNSQNSRDVHMWVFTARHNGEFKVDPNEVTEAKFFTIEEIGQMIKSGVKFHPEFKMAWERGLIIEALDKA